jgi:hypothetical protein
LLFEFADRGQGDDLIEVLRERECELYGVSVSTHSDGRVSCSALCARKHVRRKFLKLEGFDVSNIHVLDLKGAGSDSAGFIVRACSAWLSGGSTVKANFAVRTVEETTWRDLEKRWRPMTFEDCEAEILDAEERVKMKRGATSTDKLIQTMGVKVLKRKRDALLNHPSFILYANDSRILDLASYQHLEHIMVMDWCVEDGSVESYPLLDWIESGHYRTRTLVLTGDSDKGKTQVAKSMLSRLADEKLSGRMPRPYIVSTQTVEGLTTAASGGWCQQWVGLLLDELRPGQPRGTRPPMSVDELKKLCSIDIAATIDARHRDIMLSVDQPRIMTANAMMPSQWHPVLPDNLYEMDAIARMRLGPDVKAVGKRISWAFVAVSLIPQSVREAYNRRV